MDNKSLEKQFRLLADLEELHTGESFKANAYRRAAEIIKALTNPYQPQQDPPQGIGKGLHAKIKEAFDKGTMDDLSTYLEKTPEGIIDLLDVSGLGPKRVAKLWQEGYQSATEVLQAALDGSLTEVQGFGTKTVETLKTALHIKVESLGKMLLPEGQALAQLVKEIMCDWLNITQHQLEEVLIPTGQLRRAEPIITHLAFLLTHTEHFKILAQAVKATDKAVYLPQQSGPFAIQFKINARLCPITIRLTTPHQLGSTLALSTGPVSWLAKHQILDALRKNEYATEEAAFNQAEIKLPPPELRNTILDPNTLNSKNLVTNADVIGVLHAHSTYSDGSVTLKNMALAVQQKGYKYLGITDHSQSAFYAGGLKEDDIAQQHQEIDALNKEFEDFKILKGIESDILANGALDYPEQVLKTFDFVVASVHSVLNMDIEKATKRLITAIENPYTNILGHLTGRLLLMRQGYPLHFKKIIDACAANKVSIEINANPRRLDIDHTHLPYCMEKGVQISINPDAHNIDGIDHIKYGVLMARKGGLLKQFLLNRLDETELLTWFKK